MEISRPKKLRVAVVPALPCLACRVLRCAVTSVPPEQAESLKAETERIAKANGWIVISQEADGYRFAGNGNIQTYNKGSM